MIKPIYRILRDQLREMFKLRLAEAKVNEDEDFVVVIPETESMPVCVDEEELIDYIESASLSRQIEYIVIHCTATSVHATASAIQNYWRNTLKWRNPGYHILFHHDNGFTVFADFDNVTNGVIGYNQHSIHLSYIGGINENGQPIDNRSESQKRLLEIAVKELKKRLPSAIVQGHRDFPGVKKACPCFDAKQEYARI